VQGEAFSCLNRTSVGLKPAITAAETWMMGRSLNRTSVGLKQRCLEDGGSTRFEPQSNQRGIETTAIADFSDAVAERLNRTSVGLKRF